MIERTAEVIAAYREFIDRVRRGEILSFEDAFFAGRESRTVADRGALIEALRGCSADWEHSEMQGRRDAFSALQRAAEEKVHAILASGIIRDERETKAEALDKVGREYEGKHGQTWSSMLGRDLIHRAAEIREGRA